MGIPHGANMGLQDQFNRPNQDPQNRSPKRPESNDFPSFEDTFKSMKKPDPQNNTQQQQQMPQQQPQQMSQPNLADDFDNTPIPANRNQPKMNRFNEPEGAQLDFNRVDPQHEPLNIDDMPLNIRSSPAAKQAEVEQAAHPVDPNVVNVDEIQINSKQQLTFEELLEKELNDGDQASSIPDDDRVIRKKPKKQFLKRKTKTEAPPPDTNSKKYKYYADHFEKGKKPKKSGLDEPIEKLAKSKTVAEDRQRDDLGADDNGAIDSNMLSPSKTNHDDTQNSGDKGSLSSRSRRSRKARKANNGNFTENAQDDNHTMQKKNSLKEFEDIERSVGNSDDYQVVTRKNGDADSKKQTKSRHDSTAENGSKFDPSKTFTKTPETPAERQRLAKDKAEFKKQREKYESDCLALERQKRDLDKQKLEFEKTKDFENKKINAEKMKVDKERKVFSRKNEKKKDDGAVVKELQNTISELKTECNGKNKRIEKLENDIKLMRERIKHKDLQLQEVQENNENYNKDASSNNVTPTKPKSKIPGVTSSREKPEENRLLTEKPMDKINIENNEYDDHDDEEPFYENFNKGSPIKPNEDEEVPVMDEDDGNFSLVFPDKYHGDQNDNTEIVQESEGTKGKIFRLYGNDKREILFTNGVRKEIFPDGYSVVYFANEDIKQIFPDNKTVYYFADAGTVQTTMPDGLKVYKFNNEQIEKHYTDGTKEIIFPDGTVKYIFGQDDEESIFPDGTIQRLTPDGLKVVEYPSGQKDIIYPDGSKERQYASGKVKKMAADGAKN
jgi:centromere protein J